MADFLQVLQESHDLVHLQVFESQVGHGFACAQEGQKYLERIPVGANGVGAGDTDALQIVAKEGFDQGGQRIAGVSPHGNTARRNCVRRR